MIMFVRKNGILFKEKHCKCFLREDTKINVCHSLELSCQGNSELNDYQRFGTDLTTIMYSQVTPISETEFNRY